MLAGELLLAHGGQNESALGVPRDVGAVENACDRGPPARDECTVSGEPLDAGCGCEHDSRAVVSMSDEFRDRKVAGSMLCADVAMEVSAHCAICCALLVELVNVCVVDAELPETMREAEVMLKAASALGPALPSRRWNISVYLQVAEQVLEVQTSMALSALLALAVKKQYYQDRRSLNWH